MVLCGVWRDEICGRRSGEEVKTLLATSFTERYSGYRIRRILCEAVDERGRVFLEESTGLPKPCRFYGGAGRGLYLMTGESARTVSGSLANALFTFHEPVLRLRESDQELLLAALTGATESGSAAALEVTLPAVKPGGRSTCARIAASAALIAE